VDVPLQRIAVEAVSEMVEFRALFPNLWAARQALTSPRRRERHQPVTDGGNPPALAINRPVTVCPVHRSWKPARSPTIEGLASLARRRRHLWHRVEMTNTAVDRPGLRSALEPRALRVRGGWPIDAAVLGVPAGHGFGSRAWRNTPPMPVSLLHRRRDLTERSGSFDSRRRKRRSDALTRTRPLVDRTSVGNGDESQNKTQRSGRRLRIHDRWWVIASGRSGEMADGVLDEDAFFAVGSGVADDEVEVGVSIDVTEGGVGGRVVDRGEVVRGSALNRALP
jgi:hypothetical protein